MSNVRIEYTSIKMWDRDDLLKGIVYENGKQISWFITNQKDLDDMRKYDTFQKELDFKLWYSNYKDDKKSV